ncbi:MAG: hypothetical protein KDC10_05240 [Calditrichaeota bacterium]|nr:hypothetical protein [Candidatus Cloacimonadota bacterium]MCA9786407.1 hypothetical protein [Candidatus Cloacimonadota bacterium]MCB1046587.1 hypothetical protein [Calditrichota bacterium]MCB9475054.1 hypothetical protein [Candidatus Delongbacteria bacterium]
MSGTHPPNEALWAGWLDGSLSPEERARFEAWMAEHPEAARERAALEAVMADLEESSAPDVDGDLLALARGGLSRHLKNTPQLVLPRATPQPVRSGNRWIRLATRTASLAAMFLLGLILARNLPFGATPSPDTMAQALPGAVDGHSPLRPVSLVSGDDGARAMNSSVQVSGLKLEPGSEVRILLDQVQRFAIEGSAGEETIQDYLSYIIRNDNDRQRRVLALAALSGKQLKPAVREVLVHVMTHDPDGEIRMRTAGLLSSWVDEAVVAQGFMKALVDDPSPELRDYAMRTLSDSREGRIQNSSRGD